MIRSCGLIVAPLCTVVTAIALAVVPSALKYSVLLPLSKWNTAPKPEN